MALFQSVRTANEIVLLNLVSILLAIVAILLALAGVFAFFNFRNLARKQATEEAQKIAASVAENVAVEKLEAELPTMVEAYSDLVKNNLNAEEADRVANAQNQEGP